MMAMAQDIEKRFVSRAGLKLDHAMSRMGLDVTGLRCADFGCNVGGFTDCLLQHGAAHVIAVDTSYGTLDWSLRSDPRVTTKERSNAMHVACPEDPVDLVTIDVGWTPLRQVIPNALLWLKPSGSILALVKPHYEANEAERGALSDGVLPVAEAELVARRTLRDLSTLGVRVAAWTKSPIEGGGGNTEFIAQLVRREASPGSA